MNFGTVYALGKVLIVYKNVFNPGMPGCELGSLLFCPEVSTRSLYLEVIHSAMEAKVLC